MGNVQVEVDCPTNPRNQTANDQAFTEGMEKYFSESLGTNVDKLRHFPKYIPQEALGRFLARYELFQKALTVHGHIIECGVALGGGLMTWAQLSALYEPVNHPRRIIGFDTFAGFPSIHAKDQGTEEVNHRKVGGLAAPVYDDLHEAIRLYDLNRPLNHIPRVSLVKGDASKTIPEFLQKNQHLVVALLYLDFDLYEPTKAALEHFYPRMPKGAVLAFDELNDARWPGETAAVLEVIGLRNFRIQRLPITPRMSYAVLE